MIASVIYPYLTRPDEYIPLSGGELTDKLETEGYDAVNDVPRRHARPEVQAVQRLGAQHGQGRGARDRRLGQRPRVHQRRRGDRPLGRASSTRTRSTAQTTTNPLDNDNVTHSANANNVDEHVVSVEATNYMQWLDVTGVFNFESAVGHDHARRHRLRQGARHQPAGHVRASAAASAARSCCRSWTTRRTRSSSTASTSTAASASGLNLKAEEAIFQFDFSQAGASAGKYALAGTFAYAGQDTDIVAQIESGVDITGGRVDVYAGSLETQINWVGSVAKGNAIGLGLSVAVNDVDRTTRAIIGDDPDGTPSGRTSTIDVAGDINVYAKVDGELWAFTVAGTLVKQGAARPAAGA